MSDITINTFSHQQGELSSQYSGHRNVKAFYYGLREAENIDINKFGNILKRPPFKLLTKLDHDSNLFKTISMVQRNVLGEEVYYFIIFGEKKFSVYRWDSEAKTATLVGVKECDYTAEQMYYCCDCCVPLPFSMGGGIVFTKRNIKPFILQVIGDASDINNYRIKSLDLQGLPCERFNYTDKNFKDQGTFSCKYENGRWTITASQDVFTDDADSYVNQHIEINGEEFRIIKKNEGNRTLICTKLMPGATIKYENVAGEDVFLKLGYEPIASEDKGWFDLCTYAGDRLFLGGTKDFPGAIVGSCTESILDFDIGSAYENEGLYYNIPLAVGQLSAMIVTGAFYVYTTTGVWTCNGADTAFKVPRGSVVFTPETFNFTKQQSNGGSDRFAYVYQLTENGILSISSGKHQIYYTTYSDDRAAFQSRSISEAMHDDIIKQNVFAYNDVLLNSGGNFGELFFFVNKDFEIVRVSLVFQEEILPGYTRYWFNDIAHPIKLFKVGDDLLCIFNVSDETGTKEILLTWFATSGNYEEDATLDFCQPVKWVDDHYELEEGQAGDWEIYKLLQQHNLLYVAPRNQVISSRATIDGNKIMANFVGENVVVGGFYAPYIEYMEAGIPITQGSVVYGDGTLKCIKDVRFTGARFSNLYMGVKEGITAPNESYEKAVELGRAVKSDKVERVLYPYRSLAGYYQNPILVLTSQKPGAFAYNTIQRTVGLTEFTM